MLDYLILLNDYIYLRAHYLSLPTTDPGRGLTYSQLEDKHRDLVLKAAELLGVSDQTQNDWEMFFARLLVVIVFLVLAAAILATVFGFYFGGIGSFFENRNLQVQFDVNVGELLGAGLGGSAAMIAAISYAFGRRAGPPAVLPLQFPPIPPLPEAPGPAGAG